MEKTGEPSQAKELGKQLASELAAKGIADLAKNWREKVEEWNKK